MEYLNLGRSGLKVSRACLGCMTFGREADKQESFRIIGAALDAGINFFDTANIYSRGVSEEITGEALKPHRDKIVLATKAGFSMGKGPNESGLSRYHIMAECEASLRRLETDYVDLYQVHRFDPDTPIEETLRALDDLVRQGKVRYIGCSNFPAWRLCDALWTSRQLGLNEFISVQPRYNMFSREAEPELFPLCREKGIGVMTYSPLCGGILTGKYKKGQPAPDKSRPATNPNFGQFYRDDLLEKVEKLSSLAQQWGHNIIEMAIAWVLANPVVTTVILGARSVEQLRSNLAALSWQLSEEQLKQIDEVLGEFWIPPRSAMLHDWRPVLS